MAEASRQRVDEGFYVKNGILTRSILASLCFAWLPGVSLGIGPEAVLLAIPSGPVDEAASVIEVYVGHSQVVKSPWPIKRTSITDPRIAEIEPLTADSVLLLTKEVGVTDLVMWSAEEQVWRARVIVKFDLRLLESQLQELLEGSALELIQNQNVVVVKGVLRRTEDAERLHRILDALQMNYVDLTRVSGVHQVLLQVRVAEASRSAIRALGVNILQTGFHDNTFFGAQTVGSASGGSPNSVVIGPPAGAPAGPENTPFVFIDPVRGSGFNTLTLGFPRAELQFLIQALTENQYMRVLAEPTLVAQSGEEADFLAGGEFPIPIVQGSVAGGGTSITIEYKEFGVRLAFRPVVLGDGRIRLQVAPEVSDLSDVGAVEIEGFRIPAIRTRRASTTLELSTGQTFSMAGLLNRSTNAVTSRIPGIGDIPVIGSLFRSVRYQEGETELVVLVTVDLVEPMSSRRTPPLPGELHRRPDDWEVFLGGQIEGAAQALTDRECEWLRELGFDDLRGPGAWASHELPEDRSDTAHASGSN